MSYNLDDTICAISSAAGGAARGIIRITGPQAISISAHVFSGDRGGQLRNLAVPSVISGTLQIGKNLDLNAPCVVCVWPTARSYTRELVVELHTIGSPPLLQVVTESLCSRGARLAEPGEFTLRAFLAGRLDLTQAEAVLGVIDAGSHDELHSALAQLAGGLAQPFKQVRDQLVQLLAELEAGLDFVDEDIRFISHQEILEAIESMNQGLETLRQQIDSRRTARVLPRVVLLGPPNAGKSSLFNAIVARSGERTKPAALVSSQRGTTRDYLTATVSNGGTVFELVDTAGIEAPFLSDEPTIGAAAQSHAAEQRRCAELRAYCIDARNWSGRSQESTFNLDTDDCHLIVVTKSDLMPKTWSATSNALHDFKAGSVVIVTSTVTEVGLDELGSSVQRHLAAEAPPGRRSVVAATAERCRESVRLAESALKQAYDAAEKSLGDELVAAELRVALAELGKIIGVVYTDDLLERIFKTFCIGK